MAVNSSPGASSEEDQNKVSPIAERDKHQTENEQWNHDKQFSNSQDDEKGSETTSDRTDPQLFGEGGAGQD
ncbi:hypothetical protein [Deinococcus cellulosilyticus]|uniref:Uncharacterized protein n=1 Tax=Deinococcus cellulosilyticus (strain DSM 18568 / NBRC 106333 / KACC 11606 / 5516J-15) TaxID=1223518 RepID=A0A511MYU8_DEIC1|nr:hypothetical protein [Deinococcus cellulosilyticus]GEM45774.1 hypothetical protein DC3_14090 [Deinococcus cellulosilyticus NBRC 106333 = KACC 11606]